MVLKSSRKLEGEAHNNLCFIRLAGGLKPGHKTTAEFRRRNRVALKKIFRQSVRMCMGLKLITGTVLFVDGTKIRANASRGRTQEDRWEGYHRHRPVPETGPVSSAGITMPFIRQ